MIPSESFAQTAKRAVMLTGAEYLLSSRGSNCLGPGRPVSIM